MKNKQQGFTLVEVMIATAILAVIGGASAVGISSMINTQGITQEKSRSTSRLEVTLNQLSTDLENATVIKNTTPIEWDGKVLRITRKSMSSSEVYVVGWSLMPTKNGSKLSRWKSDPITTVGTWKQAWEQASMWARGGTQVGSTNLIDASDLQINFWANGWVNAQSSIVTGNFPAGVRVKIIDGDKSLTKHWTSALSNEVKS